MAVELATAYVTLTASAKGIGKSITDEIDGPVGKAADEAGDRAGKGFLGKFGASLGGIGTVVAGAFAGVAVGGFLKGAIGEASDFGEQVGKVDVVFGTSAQVIKDFADTAATSFGLSSTQALEAAGTYGNLFRAIGLLPEEAATMSTTLVGLAGDLASFNNANTDDVLLALRAGLVGETEPLRQFGININDARLKAEAFRLGLVEASIDQDKLSAANETAEKAARKASEALAKYGEGSVQFSDATRDAEQANSKLAAVMEGKMPDSLDAATKSQAAYSLIMTDTALAQGNFVDTSGGLANSTRTLGALFSNLKAKIGTAFLPAATGAVQFLSNTAIPTFAKLSDHVQPIVNEIGVRLRSAFDAIVPFVRTFAENLQAAFVAFRDGDGLVSKANLVEVFGRVKDAAVAIFDAIRGIDFGAIFGPVRDIAGQVADQLGDIDFGAVFDAAAGVVQDVVPALQAVFEAIVDITKTIIRIDFKKYFDRAVEIVEPIAEGVQTLGTALLNFVEKAAPALADAFRKLATDIAPPVIDKMLAVAEAIGEVLGFALTNTSPLIDFLGDRLNYLVPALEAATAAFIAVKVAQTGADVYRTTADGIGKVTGAYQSLTTFANENNFTLAKGAVEMAKTKSPFKQMSDGLSKVKSGFSSASTAISAASKKTLAYAKAAATSAISSLKSLWASIVRASTALYTYVQATLISIANTLKQAAAWVAQKVALVATTVATKASAAAQWLLNAAMNANPIGLIIGGLTLLAAGLLVAYQKSETFRGIVDSIGRFFRDVLWPILVDVAQAVGGFFADAFDKVSGIISVAISVYGAYLGLVLDIVKAVGGFLYDAFTIVADVVVTVAKAVGGFLVDAFNTARDAVGFVIDVVKVIADFLGGILRTQIDIAITAFGLLRDAFGWIIDKGREVYSLVSSSLDQLVGFVSGLAGRITTAASGIWDGIKESFRGVINTLIGWWNSLSFELPSVDTKIPGIGTVGGFTIRTPGISPLADGGVITSPTLALLGEVGRARPEIASPVSLMRDTFSDVLRSQKPVTIENHFHDSRVNANDASRVLAWQLRTGG